jgi:hypothetical protein
MTPPWQQDGIHVAKPDVTGRRGADAAASKAAPPRDRLGERRAREAAGLRANLRRRKDQARARSAEGPAEEPGLKEAKARTSP